MLRPLFVADCLFAEVDADERYFDGSLVIGGRMPLEHIEALFSDLRCARRPRVGDMRRMRPNHEGFGNVMLRGSGYLDGVRE